MHSAMEPGPGHGIREPARPTWTFRWRATTQPEPTATTALVVLGEAHFWPHGRMAGDLSSPGSTKIVTRGKAA
jgi:hypothetical protein